MESMVSSLAAKAEADVRLEWIRETASNLIMSGRVQVSDAKTAVATATMLYDVGPVPANES